LCFKKRRRRGKRGGGGGKERKGKKYNLVALGQEGEKRKGEGNDGKSVELCGTIMVNSKLF